MRSSCTKISRLNINRLRIFLKHWLPEQILAILSGADENVKLKDKVEIEELVENWLSILSM